VVQANELFGVQGDGLDGRGMLAENSEGNREKVESEGVIFTEARNVFAGI
jgi:hypothetical protein